MAGIGEREKITVLNEDGTVKGTCELIVVGKVASHATPATPATPEPTTPEPTSPEPTSP
jgi:hypothetical protein